MVQSDIISELRVNAMDLTRSVAYFGSDFVGRGSACSISALPKRNITHRTSSGMLSSFLRNDDILHWKLNSETKHNQIGKMQTYQFLKWNKRLILDTVKRMKLELF